MKKKNIKKEKLEVIAMINGVAYIYDRDSSMLYDLVKNEIVFKIEVGDMVYDDVENEIYSIERLRKYYYVYDARDKKFIVEGEQIVWSRFNICVYMSLDGKYHIFNEDLYKTEFCTLDMEFDSVSEMYRCNSYNSKHDPANRLIVTLNGKKGIYDEDKGIIVSAVYDEIEYKNNYFELTKGNEKYILVDDKLIGAYESVENDLNILYLRNGENVVVYDLQGNKKLFDIDCEDISCSQVEDDEYIVKVEGRYGIIKNINDTYVLLVPFLYDRVKFSYGKYYLYKGDVKACYDPRENNLTSVECDTIFSHGRFVEKYEGDNISILDAKNNNLELVKDCNEVSNVLCSFYAYTYKARLDKNFLIYKKDNEMGLITENETNLYHLSGYNNITYLDKNLFELDIDGNKELFYKRDIILKAELGYKNIKFGPKTEPLYMKLQNGEGKVKLAKLRTYNKYATGPYRVLERVNSPLAHYAHIELMDENEYDNIIFYDDIIVIYDGDSTLIYNYNYELLLEFNDILQVSVSDLDNVELTSYIIDNEYYIYTSGKLEKIESNFINVNNKENGVLKLFKRFI